MHLATSVKIQTETISLSNEVHFTKTEIEYAGIQYHPFHAQMMPIADCSILEKKHSHSAASITAAA
jgi:hypothetical protein